MVLQSQPLTWLDLLDKLWPILAGLVGLIAIAVEWRISQHIKAQKKEVREEAQGQIEDALSEFRYMTEKLVHATAKELREDFQRPIGDIGNDTLRTERRLAELETKIDVFWRRFVQDSARVFKSEDG